MSEPPYYRIQQKSFAVKHLPFIRHNFLALPDHRLEIHPGLKPRETVENYHGDGRVDIDRIVCKKCYNDMIDRAKSNTFFMPFFNCDTIAGQAVQTTFGWVIIPFIIGGILLKSIILISIALLLLLALILYNCYDFSHKTTKCEHVKNINSSKNLEVLRPSISFF